MRAAFVPSYCLCLDGSELTEMSKQSTEVALNLLKSGQVERIVLSTAYAVWEKEARQKMIFLELAHVKPESVSVIGGISDSYEEVAMMEAIIKERRITEIVVVAEEWHAPRALAVFKKKFPELKLSVQTFRTNHFERAFEPHRIRLLGWIKSVRAGDKSLWILWNLAFRVLGLLK